MYSFTLFAWVGCKASIGFTINLITQHWFTAYGLLYIHDFKMVDILIYLVQGGKISIIVVFL